jgi:cholesterol transport system auxiliary component
VRMLQRRLIATLRDAGVSRIVTDRLPNEVDALRIEGRVERFERIQTASGWTVAVGVSLRADRRDGKPPLVLREYSQELPAGGDSIRDSVAAMGAAVDRIYADFVRDLDEATPGG